MECKNCGSVLFPEDRFCGECGAPGPAFVQRADWSEPVPGSRGTKLGAPAQTAGAAVAGASSSNLPSGAWSGMGQRRLLLLILVVVGLCIAAVAGGVMAMGLGWLDVSGLLAYQSGEESRVPTGEVTLASFQAAARECRPIAAVSGIHEGVELYVLVTVEGPVGDACRVSLEVIQDETGYDLTGQHMTCGIPMGALSEGTQPLGEVADYCTGPLVQAIDRLSEEGR